MNELRELFHKGEFQKILGLIPTPGRTSEEVEVLIGAMSFLGRYEEAVDLWTLREKALSSEEKVRARFSLALAALRASHLRSAKRWFLENHKTAPPEVRDFASQGVALHEYFMGKFTDAAKWGRRALRSAVENGNSYTQFLATDLLGHAYVQMGRRSEGLRLLGQAVNLALNSGRANTAESIEVEKIIYECQFGWQGAQGATRIKQLTDNLHAQSSYTRGNLQLEGARQLTLTGRWREARQLLDHAAFSIYQFGLRRQELTLQLRLAEVAYRQSDFASVLHFLQAARRCLNHVADRTFEIRILGLEIKLDVARGMTYKENPRLARLLELSEKYSDSVNHQILARKGLWSQSDERPAEDKLHDFLSIAAISPDQALPQCLENGWLGFIPELRGETTAGPRLIVLQDQSSVISMSQEGVRHLPQALSAQSHRVLWSLKNGLQDKEKIVSAVWGYRYDPLRHDSLIYSAMTNLRKGLGEAHAFIQTSDQGWRLAGSCDFDSEKKSGSIPEISVANLDTPLEGGTDFLSFRQEKALQMLVNGPREFWDVKSFKKQFKVSPMTAFRDLKELFEKGYLKRRGRGRTTCYVSPTRKESQL